jgi:hypothetical protein
MPSNIVSFEELNGVLFGDLKLKLNLANISGEFIKSLERHLSKHKGGFKLQTTVISKDENRWILESCKSVFPSNELLSWLEQSGIEFSVRVGNNGKAN